MDKNKQIQNQDKLLENPPEIKRIKGIFRIVAGFTLIFIGLLALFVPFLPTGGFIILGLVFLSAQYLWARHLIKKIKNLIKLQKN